MWRKARGRQPASDPPAGGVLPSSLWSRAAAAGAPGARPGKSDTSSASSASQLAALAGLRRRRGEGAPARFRKRKGEESVSRKCSCWESPVAGRTHTSCSATAAFATDARSPLASVVCQGSPPDLLGSCTPGRLRLGERLKRTSLQKEPEGPLNS